MFTTKMQTNTQRPTHQPLTHWQQKATKTFLTTSQLGNIPVSRACLSVLGTKHSQTHPPTTSSCWRNSLHYWMTATEKSHKHSDQTWLKGLSERLWSRWLGAMVSVFPQGERSPGGLAWRQSTVWQGGANKWQATEFCSLSKQKPSHTV